MESKKTRVKKSSWQLHLSPDQTKIVWSTRLWNAAKKNLICVLTNVFHRYVSESLCRFRAKFQYMFLRKTWCMWCHHKDITQIQKCTFWMCFSEYLLSFFMQSCGIIWHIYLAQVLFSCRQWWNVLITVDQPHKVLMLLLSYFGANIVLLIDMVTSVTRSSAVCTLCTSQSFNIKYLQTKVIFMTFYNTDCGSLH